MTGGDLEAIAPEEYYYESGASTPEAALEIAQSRANETRQCACIWAKYDLSYEHEPQLVVSDPADLGPRYRLLETISPQNGEVSL